jgi:F-type H+-transporting ATPase subunit b
MDKLLQPDLGLTVWTIVVFLGLVLVLAKAAWKPILNGLDGREKQIRHDLDRAAKAQADAEALREKYERQLAEAQHTVQSLVAEARRDAERNRAELATAAKAEADRILEKGRADLQGETDRLRGELRAEVSQLSLDIAEKVLRRGLDRKAQEQIVQQALSEMAEVRGT